MNYLEELSNTIDALDMHQLFKLADFVRDCEGTLWIAGNGGSMATAQHWACDLQKAAGRRAVALGSNPAILTAYANDCDYEFALAEELQRLARPEERLICLSCSGTSLNIGAAIRAARKRGMHTALITMPESYRDRETVDLLVKVPHHHYGVIEDCFMAIGHWLTEELRG